MSVLRRRNHFSSALAALEVGNEVMSYDIFNLIVKNLPDRL